MKQSLLLMAVVCCLVGHSAFLGHAQSLDSCIIQLPDGTQPVAMQKGGKWIPSRDTFNVLVVFAQFPDDRFDTLNAPWPTRPLQSIFTPPTYFSTFVDSTGALNSQNANMTHYFRAMSTNQFILTGTAYFVVTPHTRDWYLNNGKRMFDINKEVLLKLDSTISFAPFDKWIRGTNYNHTKGQDSIIDMIFMLYRNVSSEYPGDSVRSVREALGFAGGQADLGRQGSYYVDGGVRKVKTYSLESGTTSVVAVDGLSLPPYHVQIHEFTHFFFEGSNSDHSGGGFWAMLNNWAARFNALDQSLANSYEREWVGWHYPDSIGTTSGIYYNLTLTDYATTNKSYKIKVPGSNPNEVYRLEYHTRASQFDTPDQSDSTAKGLYIIHQFGASNIDNSMRLIPADGNWNWIVNEEACPSYYPQGLPIYRYNYPDAVDGYNDCRVVPFTWSGGSLCSGDPPSPGHYMHFRRDWKTGQLIESTFYRGDGADQFNTTHNNLFSPWSNPRSLTNTKVSSDLAIEVVSESNGVLTFNSTSVRQTLFLQYRRNPICAELTFRTTRSFGTKISSPMSPTTKSGEASLRAQRRSRPHGH